MKETEALPCLRPRCSLMSGVEPDLPAFRPACYRCTTSKLGMRPGLFANGLSQANAGRSATELPRHADWCRGPDLNRRPSRNSDGPLRTGSVTSRQAVGRYAESERPREAPPVVVGDLNPEGHSASKDFTMNLTMRLSQTRRNRAAPRRERRPGRARRSLFLRPSSAKLIRSFRSKCNS